MRTSVEHVMVEAGAARGVRARTAAGHRLDVRARAVVAACGALNTPALLRRSGLDNPNVGRHLRLHPATAVWGVFDDEVRPWEGTMQALYSDQHRRLDGGYGVKYETAPIHPQPADRLRAVALRRAARRPDERARALDRPSACCCVIATAARCAWAATASRSCATACPSTTGATPRVGVDGAAQILEAAGARRIFSAHSKWVAYEPGVSGSREGFMAAADACGWDAGRCAFNSFHIMGSARMGGSPATSACNPLGETWDVRDLVVCDGSAFPTASGVNPMISIEAIAHMNARGLAARLA